MTKSAMPELWPVYVMAFLMINIPIYLFIIVLSFQGATWETVLDITKFERAISIAALGLLIFDIWFLIGLVRIFKRILKENKFINE